MMELLSNWNGKNEFGAVRNDETYFFIKEDEEGLPLIKRYQLIWN